MGLSRRILAIGVFDLFHVGHLRYLQYAGCQGNHLTVAITSDALCLERKGKWPVIEESQRMEIVRSLGWVDDARFVPDSLELPAAAARWMAAWKMEHVVVGGEWAGSLRWQRLTAELDGRGITVGFAPHTHTISSSEIVRRIQSRIEEPLTTAIGLAPKA